MPRFTHKNKDFEKYARDVMANIHEEYPHLIKQAQATIDGSNMRGVRIIDVTLSGSYGRGSPTEDSDIDMRFMYSGKPVGLKISGDDLRREVALTLAGNVVGNWGAYDAHAVEVPTGDSKLSLGGEGSGHHGHAGRPGEVGGSLPGVGGIGGIGRKSKGKRIGRVVLAKKVRSVSNELWETTKKSGVEEAALIDNRTGRVIVRATGDEESVEIDADGKIGKAAGSVTDVHTHGPPGPDIGPSYADWEAMEKPHIQKMVIITPTTVYEITDEDFRPGEKRPTAKQISKMYDEAQSEVERYGWSDKKTEILISQSISDQTGFTFKVKERGGAASASKSGRKPLFPPDLSKKPFSKMTPAEKRDLGFSIALGGEGSGHHGHAGRPGEVGGSLPGVGGGVKGKGRLSKGALKAVRQRFLDTYYGEGGWSSAHTKMAGRYATAHPKASTDEIAERVLRATTYVEGEHFDVNSALRRGELSSETKKTVQGIALLDSAKPGSRVYRGLGLKAVDVARLKPGAVISDKGLMSTSKSRDTASGFMSVDASSGKTSVMLSLRDKRGLGRVVPDNFGSYGGVEDEVIYPPKIRIEIHSVKQTSDGLLVKGDIL